jgi:autotransporter adhesin
MKLTSRELVGLIKLNSLIHVVDVDDTSQDPSGSSYRAEISQLAPLFSGSTTDQNNLVEVIEIDLTSPWDGPVSVSATINNLPLFTIDEKVNLVVIGSYFYRSGSGTITYLLKLGKGTYGIGGSMTPVTDSDFVVISTVTNSRLPLPTLYNPDAIVHDITGYTGTTIEDAVDTSSSTYVIQSGDDVYFRLEINGILLIYRYTGTQPITLGNGGSSTVNSDYLEFYNENTVVTNQTYVTGWEKEREIGNTVTIGLGKGTLLLTNGSSMITGTNGVDFTNQSNFDSPFNYYEAVVRLTDGSKRYISLNNNTGSTIGDISDIYSDNRYLNSLGPTWTGATGEYEYYPYFTPIASGELSMAYGYASIASGRFSHAEGRETTASAQAAHAEGFQTTSSGLGSHSEGQQTIASGDVSHAEGGNTTASGGASHAEGEGSIASGIGAHAEGQQTQATKDGSHAEGRQTIASGDYSHAEGYLSIASGPYSHAEGSITNAIGSYSHAEGNTTIASGLNSHAEGYNTTANNSQAHAEGSLTLASGINSHAEGQQTQATGTNTHAEGRETISNGVATHAEGYKTTASGKYTHTEGSFTNASGDNGHAEGNLTIATGLNSHAEGQSTLANNNQAHAEGWLTIASGNTSHVEGYLTRAGGAYSHAQGNSSQAIGLASHAEGSSTLAIGNNSHAEGSASQANGPISHAEGNLTRANGNTSHAEGFSAIASGSYSHAEGSQTIASGDASHAEGQFTTASGSYSHAEGYNTNATNTYSHAEGQNTTANGLNSHAEGYNTVSFGTYSHAEGYLTQAIGSASHAGGESTIAQGNTSFVHGFNSLASGDYSTVLGRNITGATADTTYVDNLNIKTVATGTTLYNLGVNANGKVIRATAAASTIDQVLGAGSTSTGKTMTMNHTNDFLDIFKINNTSSGNMVRVGSSWAWFYNGTYSRNLVVIEARSGESAITVNDINTNNYLSVDAMRKYFIASDGGFGAAENSTRTKFNSYSFRRNSNEANIKADTGTLGTGDWVLPLAFGKIGVVGTTAPASAAAAGVVGEIRVTATFIYACIAPNTWVRSAAATW